MSKWDAYNFLTGVKDLITGGGYMVDGVTPRDDAGFLVDRPLNIPADLRTSAGLTLTAATTPEVILTETNGLTVVGAASTTANGSFMFTIPRDYDEATDIFQIRVLAGMDGNTDTPTLTATMYRKRAGVNLSADLAPTASAALANSSAWKTIDASKKSMLRDDVLTINLVAATHTTDDVSIHAVEVVYRSTLVSYHESLGGTRDGKDGTFLR